MQQQGAIPDIEFVGLSENAQSDLPDYLLHAENQA